MVLTVRFCSKLSAFTKPSFVYFVLTPALLINRFRPLSPITPFTCNAISSICFKSVTSTNKNYLNYIVTLHYIVSVKQILALH